MTSTVNERKTLTITTPSGPRPGASRLSKSKISTIFDLGPRTSRYKRFVIAEAIIATQGSETSRCASKPLSTSSRRIPYNDLKFIYVLHERGWPYPPESFTKCETEHLFTSWSIGKLGRSVSFCSFSMRSYPNLQMGVHTYTISVPTYLVTTLSFTMAPIYHSLMLLGSLLCAGNRASVMYRFAPHCWQFLLSIS
jgi:hypothetical protein